MKRKAFLIFRATCRLIFWGGIALAFYFLISHVNYTQDGYCWGTIEKCYGMGL